MKKINLFIGILLLTFMVGSNVFAAEKNIFISVKYVDGNGDRVLSPNEKAKIVVTIQASSEYRNSNVIISADRDSNIMMFGEETYFLKDSTEVKEYEIFYKEKPSTNSIRIVITAKDGKEYYGYAKIPLTQSVPKKKSSRWRRPALKAENIIANYSFVSNNTTVEPSMVSYLLKGKENQIKFEFMNNYYVNIKDVKFKIKIGSRDLDKYIKFDLKDEYSVEEIKKNETYNISVPFKIIDISSGEFKSIQDIKVEMHYQGKEYLIDLPDMFIEKEQTANTVLYIVIGVIAGILFLILILLGLYFKPNKNDYCLVFQENGLDVNTYNLIGEKITIGRNVKGPGSIKIDDPHISNTHAVLLRGRKGFEINDLGSSNGTFVNGQRITQNTKLKNNDVIELDSLKFMFRKA